MNRWYSECIDFLYTSEKLKAAYKESGITEDMMMTALKELKNIYESSGFAPDPDFVIRCDHLIGIIESRKDSPFYACWQMWTPYFTFMGMSSWNEMWQNI